MARSTAARLRSHRSHAARQREPQPLKLTPGRLHFADTIGQLRVELTNTSNAPIRVTPRIDSPGYRLDDVRSFIVPGNGSIGVIVIRDDVTTPALFGELILTTDAAHQPELRVPLLARFKQSCLSTSDTLRFAAQFVGCGTASQKVTLTNDCPHAVNVGIPQLDSPFHLVSARPGKLTAGASTEVSVAFKPTTLGLVSTAMSVPVDVLDGQRPIAVGLIGDATELPLRDERYTVPNYFPDADVLLVLDDTPVMAAHAESIRSNLERLNFRYVGQKPRYAVTTTSMVAGEQGRLRRTASGATWLEAPASTELAAFTALTGTQTGGSSCIEAIDHLLTASSEVTAFRRADAVLSVICITANVDSARGPVGTMIDRIERFSRGGTLVAVVGRFSGTACPGELDTGSLSALPNHVNGVKAELCAGEWASWVDNSISYFGFRTYHSLQARPDFSVAPLRVYADGTEVFPPSWRYEPLSNTVNFEPIFEPNLELRMTYAAECQR
ncbi:MAG: hypothetical protein ACO1OB_00495 [Archangium sp.]